QRRRREGGPRLGDLAFAETTRADSSVTPPGLWPSPLQTTHHPRQVSGRLGCPLSSGAGKGASEGLTRNRVHAYLVQAVRAAGKCDAVFKGFSDCLLKLGDSMANYPQGLDDKTNIKTVCTYWEDFHSCTVTALTDCQEGAKDMWDKLRKESKNLNIQGSLFELCGSGNGAAGSLLPALPVLLVSLSAALATWLSF
uniref:Neuritin 1 n=1 Tax=Macaca mulatta TaxID=9544 RepID=A0A5F7ZXN4_MACMU